MSQPLINPQQLVPVDPAAASRARAAKLALIGGAGLAAYLYLRPKGYKPPPLTWPMAAVWIAWIAFRR